MSTVLFVLAVCAALMQNGVSELLLLLLALMGAYRWWQAFRTPEGWRAALSWTHADTHMAWALMSVCVFKLLAALWSAQPMLGLSNAVRHLGFLLWPLVFMALRGVRGADWVMPRLAVAILLMALAEWMTWWLTGTGLMWTGGRLNTGVLAQLMLVLTLWCWVWFTGHPFSWMRSPTGLLMLLAWVAGAWLVFQTTRRIEWLGLLALTMLIGIWRIRHRIRRSHVVALSVITLAVATVGVAALWWKFQIAIDEMQAYLQGAGSTGSVGIRLEMYVRAWRAWLDHPWLGMGSGVRPSQLMAYAIYPVGADWNGHFHSEYLQVLVEGGLLGLACAAMVLWVVCRYLVFRPTVAARSTAYPLMAFALLSAYLIEGLTSAALTYGAAIALMVCATAWLWSQVRYLTHAPHGEPSALTQSQEAGA